MCVALYLITQVRPETEQQQQPTSNSNLPAIIGGAVAPGTCGCDSVDCESGSKRHSMRYKPVTWLSQHSYIAQTC